MSQSPHTIVVPRKFEAPIYDHRWPNNCLNPQLVRALCNTERATTIAKILGGQLIDRSSEIGKAVWDLVWEGDTRIVSRSRLFAEINTDGRTVKLDCRKQIALLTSAEQGLETLEFALDIHAGAVVSMRKNNKLMSTNDVAIADRLLAMLSNPA